MSILVTGAGGFVGRHLCERLLLDGAHVVGTFRDLNLFEGSTHPIAQVPPGLGWAAQGDIRDPDFCQRVVSDYAVDVVYHLAAHSIVSVCAEAPVNAFEVAVMGTARLLEAVRSAGRPIRVVVMTSDKAYGDAPSPYTEQTPLGSPLGAYDASKACQDIIARMYASEYNMNASVVRAVNIYGPGDPNQSRIVPQTLLRLSEGRPPRLNAGAHLMRRQYVHVHDLVRALRLIADEGLDTPAWCVGSPDPPMSAAEVIATIQALWQETTGVALNAEAEAWAGGFQEILEQSADDRQLRALGWTPRITFRDGIRKLIVQRTKAAT